MLHGGRDCLWWPALPGHWLSYTCLVINTAADALVFQQPWYLPSSPWIFRFRCAEIRLNITMWSCEVDGNKKVFILKRGKAGLILYRDYIDYIISPSWLLCGLSTGMTFLIIGFPFSCDSAVLLYQYWGFESLPYRLSLAIGWLLLYDSIPTIGELNINAITNRVYFLVNCVINI